MVHIRFTPALRRFFPDLGPLELQAQNIHGLLNSLEDAHPGLSAYLIDDQGRLRQHVNIFINNQMIRDREKLLDAIASGDEIYIMQALSGG